MTLLPAKPKPDYSVLQNPKLDMGHDPLFFMYTFSDAFWHVVHTWPTVNIYGT